jgi:hypothetical protein
MSNDAFLTARFQSPAKPMISADKLAFSVTLSPGARCKHCNCSV